MFVTILKILCALSGAECALLLIGLVMRVIYDNRETAPAWVEGVALFLTYPQGFREWKEEQDEMRGA